MTAWWDAVLARTFELALGTSAVLAIGVVVVACARRTPIVRQRWAEWTAVVAVSWLLLSVVPLPRWFGDLVAFGVAGTDARVDRGLDQREPSSVRAVPSEAAAPTVARRIPPTATPQPTAPSIGAASTTATRPGDSRSSEPRVSETVPDARGTEPLQVGSRPDVAVLHAGSTEPSNEPRNALDLDSASTFDARRAAGWLWLLGGGVAVAYLLLGWVALRRVLAARVALPSALRAVVAETLGVVGRRVRLVVSERATVPFVCGLGRPTIVLPAALARPELASRVRAVLRHELAHVRQGDLRGRAAFALALPLLWWNPCFWWLQAQARLAAELVADDLAVRGSSRDGYARQLIALAEMPDGAPRVPVAGALAVRGRPSEFFRRMTMLLNRDGVLATATGRGQRVMRSAIALLVVAGSACVWGVPVAAQDAPRRTARIQELENERAALSNEIARLRAQIEAMRTAIADETAAVTAPVPARPPGLPSARRRGSRYPGGAGGVADAPAAVPTPRSVSAFSTSPARVRAKGLPRATAVTAPEPPAPPHTADAAPRRVVADAPLPEIAVVEELPEPEELVEEPELIETVVEEPSPPSVAGQPRAVRATSLGGSAIATAGPKSELLMLVTRAIELEGELMASRGKLEHSSKLAERGFVSATEIEAEKHSLRTAERKLRVVRLMIETELEQAMADLKYWRTMATEGYIENSPEQRAAKREVRRLEGRLRVLEQGL